MGEIETMTIHVTPIPSTVEFAAPSFTLTTANAAGDALTAVASNSNLLAFDTGTPTSVALGGSAAVGSQAIAARRDHAHAMAAIQASARVYNDAAQSIADSTTVYLAYNSESFDVGNLHDNSTNNSRLTFATAGVYFVGANISWGTTSDVGYRQVMFRVNGSTIIGQSALDGDAISSSPRQQSMTCWSFDADDYVEFGVYQNTGGAINVNSLARYSADFWAARIA